MIVARTIAEIRGLPRARGTRMGLVPTMGALHAGHKSLFDAARAECDHVIASVFVNPTQFDDPGDLTRYPRDEPRDAALAAGAGIDVLFAPGVSELYPDGFDTWVDPGQIATVLEGAFRPGHFRGVTTVCLKLFHIVSPDVVYFGQKDAQQVEVIRRMLRDLDLPIALRVLPTVRDSDGLAISSRNARLSSDGRRRALALPRALATRDPERARALLEGLEIEYVAVAPFSPPVLAAAVRVDGVRLIDNIVLDEPERHPAGGR